VRRGQSLINTARGLTKSYGERLRGCNPRNMKPEKASGLSPELQAVLEPLRLPLSVSTWLRCTILLVFELKE
jgi:hypothetical protein